VYADGCVAGGLQLPRISARKLNIEMVDVLYETSNTSQIMESVKEIILPEHVGIFFACFGNFGHHFLDNFPKSIRNVLFHHQYGPM
jgi:hypothetical protein